MIKGFLAWPWVMSTYLCKIRVRLLRINSIVVLDVLEALVHDTAITACVSMWPRAIHQILLTQGDQLACFSEVLALQRSYSAEGPA